MVEPVTYFCTTSPVTAICFYQPRSQNSKKTLLVAGTGSGTLSAWDLTSCSLEQVFANSKEWACNIFFINALESLSFKSTTTLDAQCTIFLCLSKICSPIVSFHWTFQKVLYREFLFLKWQPCHFPVMAFCFVVLIFPNLFIYLFIWREQKKEWCTDENVVWMHRSINDPNLII